MFLYLILFVVIIFFSFKKLFKKEGLEGNQTTNEQTNQQTNEQTNQQTNEQTNQQTNDSPKDFTLEIKQINDKLLKIDKQLSTMSKFEDRLSNIEKDISDFANA